MLVKASLVFWGIFLFIYVCMFVCLRLRCLIWKALECFIQLEACWCDFTGMSGPNEHTLCY